MGSGLVRKIPDRAWSPLGNCRWWDQKVSWLGGHADTARADKPSAHWPVMTLTLPSSPPFSSSSPHPHAEARRSGTLGMGDISLPWLTPTSRRPSLVKKEKKTATPKWWEPFLWICSAREHVAKNNKQPVSCGSANMDQEPSRTSPMNELQNNIHLQWHSANDKCDSRNSALSCNRNTPLRQYAITENTYLLAHCIGQPWCKHGNMIP